MVKKCSQIMMLCSMFFTFGCSPDPCEVAHTVIDGECIPDFIFPQNPNLTLGKRYYHPKYGVVTFKYGQWYDSKLRPIPELKFTRN